MEIKIFDMTNPADVFLLCAVSGVMGGLLYEHVSKMLHALMNRKTSGGREHD